MKSRDLFTFLTTVNLVATLIAIPPDTAVHIGLDVARHLHKVKCYAHLGVLGVECHRRHLSRTSWANTRGETTQAVFATRPLANGKLASISKSGSATNVRSVLSIIEPLALVGACSQITICVTDIDLCRRIDVLASGAFLVATELEFSISLDHAVWCSIVDIVVAEAESVAVFSRENVAFA